MMARGRLAGGVVPALPPPATFPGFEAPMDPIPSICEHTDRILARIGYGAEEIAALRADGVIRAVKQQILK